MPPASGRPRCRRGSASGRTPSVEGVWRWPVTGVATHRGGVACGFSLSARCPLAIHSLAPMRRATALAAVLLIAAALGACGSGSSTRASATPSAAPSASAIAAGPCSSVRTTTPIDRVPAACAAAWAPYRVTMVPPPDLIEQEHVPAPPAVRNMTNGAVSDSEAQRWAVAANRESGWYRWAEMFSQPQLLSKLVAPALVPAKEMRSLNSGAHIDQPDCDLFPRNLSLFPVDDVARRYFLVSQHPTGAGYTFVATFDGPCRVEAIYPDGRREPITTLSTGFIGFAAGSLRMDPWLGAIWYQDAAGNCSVGAPPPSWCER